MFDVTLTGVDALLKKFDAVAARVHSLQYTIPREFEDWRTRGHAQPLPDAADHPARAQAARHQTHLEPRPRQGTASIRARNTGAGADIPGGRCCGPSSTSS